MFRTMTLVVAFFVLVAASGCGAIVVAGATGVAVAYYMGEGRKAYDADVNHATDAVRQVIKDMNLVLIREKEDGGGREIVTRTTADEQITFTMKTLTPKTTELRVRVGYLGNQARTNTIFDSVDKALK
jgi:hypothetical protein